MEERPEVDGRDAAPDEVTVLESRTRHFARLLPIPAASAGLLAALAASVSPVLIAAAPLFVIVPMLIMIARAKRPRRVRARGQVVVDARGLSVGERLLVPRAQLREGVVVPDTDEGTLVRLGGRLSQTDVVVRDAEAGRALLARLKLDPAHATGRVRIRAPSVAHFRARARLALPAGLSIPGFMALGLISKPLLVLMIVALALFLPVALSMAIGGEATVGSDGVLVRWLWTRRFIPLDDVTEARVEQDEPFMNSQVVVVRLYRGDGSVKATLMVDAAQEGDLQEPFRAVVTARAQALAERIREAIAARGSAAGEPAAHALERGERGARDWIAYLRGLLARTETFRDGATPSREALLRMVEDAQAAPAVRAAAAVAALGATGSEGDDEARARIRIAAQTSAAPKLRFALERAAEAPENADASDEALAEALVEIDAPKRRLSR